MPRPARIPDANFAARVRAHMEAEGMTASRLADMLGVDKSTLGRSLDAGAFSASVKRGLQEIIDPTLQGGNMATRLRKALRLLAASDKLRQQADRLLIDALDQAGQNK